MNIVNELTAFEPLAKLVVPRRSALPILTHIIVRNGVMAATDLDHWIEIPIDYSGDFTMDSAMLTTLAKGKSDSIEITQDKAEESRMNLVIDGTQNVSYKSKSPTDFPERPRGKFKKLGKWDKEMVAYMVNMKPFISNDELKPSLMGMLFKQNDMKAEMCATDGHKLRRVRNVQIKSPEIADFIISTKAIGIVAKYMDKTVEVALSDRFLRFKLSNGVTLFHRFINERYPDYASVMPPDDTGDSYRVNRKDMLKALKTADSFANRTTHQIAVNLEREGTVVKVSSEDIETDVSWKTELPMLDYKGEGLEIGYNLRYFEDILKTIDSDMVTITNTTAASPSIITGDDEWVDHLLMPIRLND